MLTCCVGVIFVGLVAYKCIDLFIRRFYINDFADRYIFITGCDTGFGNLAAKRLDSTGCHVFAGCLTEKGETELRKSCSPRLITVNIDVSNSESVRNAFETVKSQLPPNKGLWGLVNNAGVSGIISPSDWLTVEDYKSLFNVNLFGTIDVTMKFLPLIQQAKGRIVNTASVMGHIASGDVIPYCSSKFGVEGFTDGLRRAMHNFGVKVITVEPGNYKTAINSPEHVARAILQTWDKLPVEKKEEYGENYPDTYIQYAQNLFRMGSECVFEVADTYQHALLAKFPRSRYQVGVDAQFIWMPMSKLPEWATDILLRLVDFMCKHPVAAIVRRSRN